MKSTSESEVAPVGQRGDDESSGIAKIFEAVSELCIDSLDEE